MTRLGLLILICLLTPSLSLAANLYRAPDNLFAINVPKDFKPLGDMGSGGKLLVKTGFQYRLGRTRAYLGIHVFQNKASLTNFIDEHRKSITRQPNYSLLQDKSSVIGGALAHRFSYSFAYDDDRSYRILREDTLLTLRQKGVLIYLETSKNAIRNVKGLFESALASFRSAHTINVATKSSTQASTKAKFCTDCGKARVQDGRFCPYCGSKYRVAGSPVSENKPQPASKPQKAPAPKVIIAGKPPLTEKTLAIWRMLVEWTARTRLTAKQEQKLRRAVINEYKAGGTRRTEMVSLDKDFNPTKLYQLEEKKAKVTREKLKKQFATLSRTIRSTNSDGAIFEEVVKSVSTKLVRSEPPLTSQTRDSAIELLGFMIRLLEDGDGATIQEEVGDMMRIRFGSKLRHRWSNFTKDLKKRFSDLVYLWSDLRLAWEFASAEKRNIIAEGFKTDARSVARRPGGVSFSSSSRLAKRVEEVLAERPGVLVNLAKKLDERLKKEMGKKK